MQIDDDCCYGEEQCTVLIMIFNNTALSLPTKEEFTEQVHQVAYLSLPRKVRRGTKHRGGRLQFPLVLILLPAYQARTSAAIHDPTMSLVVYQNNPYENSIHVARRERAWADD